MSGLEKLLATTGARQIIHEFIAWLMLEKGIELNELLSMSTDTLVESFFGLNSDQLDQEALDLELAADYPHGRQP
jgi:hypothetical protein